jgi:RNA-directed DNA polymerase
MIDLSPLFDPALVYHYINVLPRHATHCMKHMKDHVRIGEITTNAGRKRRKIYAPQPQLSWVQNRIRHGLLLQVATDDCVHGFVRGRGIVSNALVHAHRRCVWVMNLDLKDFFPSINFGRIRGLYSSLFNFNAGVATQLARLTTYHNHLAQGFCTSPDLANFVAWKLDRRLAGLARAHGIHYSRYADDLTFSSTESKPTPESIRRSVTAIVGEEGFKVNDDKVAIMAIGRRQVVTGLVVSEHGVNLNRRVRRLLRSAVNHWPEQTPERRVSIMGWLSYLNAVDPALSAKLMASMNEEPRIHTKSLDTTMSFSDDVCRLLPHKGGSR